MHCYTFTFGIGRIALILSRIRWLCILNQKKWCWCFLFFHADTYSATRWIVCNNLYELGKRTRKKNETKRKELSDINEFCCCCSIFIMKLNINFIYRNQLTPNTIYTHTHTHCTHQSCYNTTYPFAFKRFVNIWNIFRNRRKAFGYYCNQIFISINEFN